MSKTRETNKRKKTEEKNQRIGNKKRTNLRVIRSGRATEEKFQLSNMAERN